MNDRPTRSPDLDSIAEALIAFQMEMPTVSKSKTAQVPTKSGGSYSYTYADLASVVAAATPLLTKHGLSFTCSPRQGERSYELAGVLLHSSGQWIEGCLPLNGSSAQEVGSAITYARRYLLGAMTGIVTDDDDDGASAQGASATRGWAGPPTNTLLSQIDSDAARAGVTYELATARFRGNNPIDWLDQQEPWVIAPLAAQVKKRADEVVAQREAEAAREAAAAEADKATAPVAGAGTAAGEAGDPWGPKDGATDA